MADISVTGAAHRLLNPERGTARVVVRVEGEEREEVAASATALHERLTADARRFVEDAAAIDWSADQVWVSTSERYRGPKKEPKRITVATASIRVVFVDFPALSRWLAELAEQEGAQLLGIDWSVSDDRRRAVEREVRTEAALDALGRARAYATALGLETVELVGMYEPGLRRDDERGGADMVWGRTSAGLMASSTPSPEFAVRPQDLEIRAEVTADFSAR